MSNDLSQRMRTPNAASYLGVSQSKLRKARVYGDGPPYIKLGRLVIYDRADLDHWVESRKFHSTSEYTFAA